MLLYKSQGYRNFLVKYDRDSLSWISQNWLQDSFETDGFKLKRATGVASENLSEFRRTIILQDFKHLYLLEAWPIKLETWAIECQVKDQRFVLNFKADCLSGESGFCKSSFVFVLYLSILPLLSWFDLLRHIIYGKKIGRWLVAPVLVTLVS